MRGDVATAVIAVTLGAVVAGATPAHAADTDLESARASVAAVRGHRADHDRGPISIAEDLRVVAERHAFRMAERGEIFHNQQLGGEVEGWDRIAENVGVGSSIGQVDESFYESSMHRGNMLGPYDEVGIGVVVEQGEVYVVQVFAHRQDGAGGAPDADASPQPRSERPAATRSTEPSIARAPPAPRPAHHVDPDPPIVDLRRVRVASVAPVGHPSDPSAPNRLIDPWATTVEAFAALVAATVHRAAVRLGTWLEPATRLPLRA